MGKPVVGTLKKIGIGVAIPVLAGIVLIFANAAYNEYAEVGYQLNGPSFLDLNFDSSLEVKLKEENEGNLAVVPISTVVVKNANIIDVSINGVAQYMLSDYCTFNETMATITNLRLSKGRSLSDFATIHVLPNEGVPTFSIKAEVILPPDMFHPRNDITRILPFELVYNQTSANRYSLLD